MARRRGERPPCRRRSAAGAGAAPPARARPVAVAAIMAAVAVAAAAAAAGTAEAHPFTDETVPARFSSAPVGTSEVVVRYSESVEIAHSSLEVFDGDGNRVDNGDTAYHGGGDTALVVTTAPLGEGTYTVASKVLSRVDGHLVPSAFVFGVGDAVVAAQAGEAGIGDMIFFDQAGARFPGLAGQTVVLGAVMSSLLVWAGVARRHPEAAADGVAAAVHSRLMTLVGIGLVAVLASNMIMLAVQMVSLDTSAAGVLGTSFGATWIVRMGITAALIGAWFAAERRRRPGAAAMAPLLALSLALAATTTMMGHGMASGEPAAAALDYLHNLVAAAWIGGVAYLAFALLPALRGAAAKGAGDALMLAAIPRFTVIASVSIGAVAASGPVLMWMLDGDLGDIAGSVYGQLIMAKVGLALSMVGIAAHHHRVRAAAVRAIRSGGRADVLRRVGPGLRAEAVVGLALIGVVALLANSILPDGQLQLLQDGGAPGGGAGGWAGSGEPYAGLSAVEYAPGAAFGVEIRPFAPGANTVRIAAAGHDGGPLPDLDGVKVKVSNPLRGIAPIEVPVREEGGGEGGGGAVRSYAAEVAFGFPGRWQLEIEALRSGSANEAVAMDLLVKPRLADVSARITEYDFPAGAGAPLYPQYDAAAGAIWITDASEPAVWKFSPADESFERYPFEGQASITLDVDPSDGRVWFTDIPEGRIGYVDPSANSSGAVDLPRTVPLLERDIPVSLDADGSGGVWISVVNKNVLARYDRGAGEFDVHMLPTAESAPFAAVFDGGAGGEGGRVWFTQQGAGQIGYLDVATGAITETAPPGRPLGTPETLTVAPDGSLWVAEHEEGGGIARYDPALGWLERVPAPDPAAYPNSVVLDRYGNVWFAMHTVDKLGAYDPQSGAVTTVPIPSAGSWVQFMTADGDGNVWFVEQGTAKLGRLSVGYALAPGPGPAPPPAGEPAAEARYSEVAGPLVAAAIVAASLMAVQGVRCRREADAAAGSQAAGLRE